LAVDVIVVGMWLDLVRFVLSLYFGLWRMLQLCGGCGSGCWLVADSSSCHCLLGCCLVMFCFGL